MLINEINKRSVLENTKTKILNILNAPDVLNEKKKILQNKEPTVGLEDRGR